jgi:chromosome segregation ATPase
MMTNEELISAFRGVVREEVNAGEQRMRVLVREEVNAAVYASEQRMTEQVQATEQRLSERLDKIEEREGKMEDSLDKVGKRQNHLEGMVLPMAEHLKLLRTDLREMRTDQIDMRRELRNVVQVLDLVSMRINELERAQANLENKVEISLNATNREKQEMYKMLEQFTREYNAIIRDTHTDLDLHENTPIDETHPRRRPHSTA